MTNVRPLDRSMLKEKLAAFPKAALGCLPTPLVEARSLGRNMKKGLRVFIKRDDLTGMALGGNKARKLEYIIGDALSKKADTLVTWGGIQSNWCLQSAVAARLCGLEPVLVLLKPRDGTPIRYEGNIFLEKLAGARLDIRETAEVGKIVNHDEAMVILEDVAAGLRKSGRKPYTVGVGGSYPGGSMDKPYGGLGYVQAFVEIVEQLERTGAGKGRISLVHAAGSGSTQAGLIVAAKALAADYRIIAVSVGDARDELSADVLFMARGLARLLGLDLKIGPEDVVVVDDYVGGGYAVLGAREVGTICSTLRNEGFILDPVYTGKAMSGWLDLARKGFFAGDEASVFLQTGGTPALFAYGPAILAELG